MGIFYHFSHFFEFLTGVYFGGAALLGFIENSAIASLYEKVQKRQVEAKSGKVVVNEFFKSFKPYENLFKFILGGLIMVLFCDISSA